MSTVPCVWVKPLHVPSWKHVNVHTHPETGVLKVRRTPCQFHPVESL